MFCMNSDGDRIRQGGTFYDRKLYFGFRFSLCLSNFKLIIWPNSFLPVTFKLLIFPKLIIMNITIMLMLKAFALSVIFKLF